MEAANSPDTANIDQWALRHAQDDSPKNSDYFKHSTISEDRTTASDFGKNQLRALNKLPAKIDTQNDVMPSATRQQVGGIHDYVMPPATRQQVGGIHDYVMPSATRQQVGGINDYVMPSAMRQQVGGIHDFHFPGSSAAPIPDEFHKVALPYSNMSFGPMGPMPDMTYSSERRNQDRLQLLMNEQRDISSRSIPSRKRQSATGDDDDSIQNFKRQRLEIQSLSKRLTEVEEENIRLRELTHASNDSSLAPRNSNLEWKTLYRLANGMNYLEEPYWKHNAQKSLVLAAESPVIDPKNYILRNSNIAFVVIKDYTRSIADKQNVKEAYRTGILPPPESSGQGLLLSSANMISALRAFFNRQESFKQLFPELNLNTELSAPYLWWYYYRSNAATIIDRLPHTHKKYMLFLRDWLELSWGSTFDEVSNKFSKLVISPSLMPYFIVPGEILVSKNKDQVVGYMASSWIKEDNENRYGTNLMVNPNGPGTWKWKLDAWTYNFNRSIYKKTSEITVELHVTHKDDETDMQKLEIMPLRYAKLETQRLLESRSLKFWSCRFKRLISSKDAGDLQLNTESDRFMIDHEAYYMLHPEHRSSEVVAMDSSLSPEIMARNEPPLGSNRFLFPPTIRAYNLRRKKWVDINVDQIEDVNWNKQAFSNLVLGEQTKELMQALITSRLAAEMSTDLISGKGNGLIILLHGPPGTGKTYTAETVAEIAEKPLYRVTCGDIGTEPEQVEKYLESVLHIGKLWGCVVLLDEADVFLEERSLTDLQRNALVSVFLRLLEYYDGILILTSNRVGTFDEAFKSRILLSIAYENLNPSQRKKIWQNFIDRLKSLGEDGIDYVDVEWYIPELATIEMNGREIRNAITIARHLAKYQQKKMSSDHLRHVIEVYTKFDKYLHKVKNGLSDDQVARSSGIR